jgi:hypothetical protein
MFQRPDPNYSANYSRTNTSRHFKLGASDLWRK